MATAALETWIQPPKLTPGLSICRAWGLRGGSLICSAPGRSVLAVLGPPGLCLSPGEVGSWAVSRRPVLPGLCCWICAPGGTALSVEPPPEPSKLLRVPPCVLQPLGSSAHSPRVTGVC